MYNTIYVPVDNSEYSNRAIDKAVAYGSAFESKIVGSHVYAAKMHDYRFKQMEYTLPEEYLQEEEIERQRKIHDSLITMGLELISDSYLDQLDAKCKEQKLECIRKMMDGKHHVEILRDIKDSEYDLVVIGVLGVGKTRDSLIGSVCERVARHSDKDVLVVKHLKKDDEPDRDTILVGVDGSPNSFGALITAIELAKKFDKKIEVIGVYDPYLHYAVFNGIVDVLSEQAAKVFRFEEQNQLHEEVIDTGLAQIYQSHLNVAEQMAKEKGVTVKKTLLDGKAFQKLLNRSREINPWLVVIGRVGVHSAPGETGLGSNAENILRLCPCDVLLTTHEEFPEIDKKAEESILWTAEAEERMKRVPGTVRGIARTGILRLAIEEGHSVITNTVIDQAMDRFMPKYTAKRTEQLAEALVLEHSKKVNIALCKKCGVSAHGENPVKCSVCGGVDFHILTPDVIEKIVQEEGGSEEDVTYDGRKLTWSRDARRQLVAIEDQYQKRRAKARIEKAARMKRLNTITVEFAKAVIEDEVGKVLFDVPSENPLNLSQYNIDADKHVIAVDDNGTEIKSVFSWTDEALSRLLNVPAGFMRGKTQERIESLALDKQVDCINLSLVEQGLELGRSAMASLLEEQGIATKEEIDKLKETASETGKCPFSSMFSSTEASGQQKNGKPISNVYGGAVGKVLNEVGVMSTTHRRREEIKSSKE
jgi:nucleotide-binding universal stress UspA family protein